MLGHLKFFNWAIVSNNRVRSTYVLSLYLSLSLFVSLYLSLCLVFLLYVVCPIQQAAAVEKFLTVKRIEQNKTERQKHRDRDTERERDRQRDRNIVTKRQRCVVYSFLLYDHTLNVCTYVGRSFCVLAVLQKLMC